MRIFINNESFRVESYDDIASILQKYSMKKKDTLPEFYRIVSEEYKSMKDEMVEIVDIRDELKGVPEKEFFKNINDIQKKYPGVGKKEIAIIWILSNDAKRKALKDIMDNLRKVDIITFTSSRETERLLKEFPKEIEKRRKMVAKQIAESEEISKVLNKIEKKVGNIKLEEITNQITLELPYGESLEDVFDSISVSRDIPFMLLSYKGKEWFKIYKHICPPREWFEFYPTLDGLYFKILRVPYSKLSLKSTRLNEVYSNGVWKTSNNIELDVNVGSLVDKDTVMKKLFDSMDMDYEKVFEKQLRVKGIFSVESVIFNKAVFSDMVMNNDILSHFLFLDERKKTSLQKKGSSYTVKYSIGGAPLTIQITPHTGDGDEWIDVRVSRAATQYQMKSFSKVFGKLLGVYQRDYENVIDIYNTISPSSKKALTSERFVLKEKGKRKDIKTGERLRNLKRDKPNLFRTKYSSMCEKNRQPYLVTNPEEVEELKKEFGWESAVEFPYNSGDFYFCNPRAKDELSIKNPKLYAGLKQNIEKEYAEEHPYLPCCFERTQYKPNTRLARYIEAKGRFLEEVHKDIKHIFDKKKIMPVGRFGEVPDNIKKMAERAGYETVNIEKKKIIPILRFSLPVSPDSFLHCLEIASNPDYSSKGEFDRVRKVREEMSKMDFSVGKQELYDYTDKNIKDMLLDEEFYIDPNMFISLAEMYYDCNIFLYVVDEKNPDGNVSIPRFSQAYLLKPISRKRCSVFIIKRETGKAGNFPYQCEIIVERLSSKNIRYRFNNGGNAFVSEAMKALEEANTVSIITPYKKIPYDIE